MVFNCLASTCDTTSSWPPFFMFLQEYIAVAYQGFVDENEKTSRRTCESLLSSLHQAIENDFKAGKYACPGGYERYRADMDSLVQRYRQTPGKGVMVSIVGSIYLCALPTVHIYIFMLVHLHQHAFVVFIGILHSRPIVHWNWLFSLLRVQWKTKKN